MSRRSRCAIARRLALTRQIWLEKLVVTRAVSAMSPCIWAEPTLARRFLHGTWLGRKVVDAFWWVLSEDVRRSSY